MDWIVEDGTGVDDANCYINADGVRAYALARGIVLPAVPILVAANPEADPPVVEVDGPDPIAPWMILAMDYLAMQVYDYEQATYTQALAWPRKYNRWSTCFIFPVQLTFAQAQLVIEQFNGINLFTSKAGFNQSGGFITREKVDVLETNYSEKVVPGAPDMPAVFAWLKGLLLSGGGLRTVRV
jgi:hypothetical protein